MQFKILFITSLAAFSVASPVFNDEAAQSAAIDAYFKRGSFSWRELARSAWARFRNKNKEVEPPAKTFKKTGTAIATEFGEMGL